MKTTSIIILCFLSIFSIMVNSVTHAQIVIIPDANLKLALIQQGVDKNRDGQIQYTEAEPVEMLLLDSKSIESLTGIEAFINLKNLNCSTNELETLDLRMNTALNRLDCSQNKLTTLNVSNSILLKELYCYMNSLTTLDISKNTALEKFTCFSNQLTTLDISKNTELSYFMCNFNPKMTIICVNITQLGLTASSSASWMKDETALWSSDCL